MNKEIFVLDSNIWISFIINGQFYILAEKIVQQQLEIVTCPQLIKEIGGVLKREKFKRYITKKDIAEAIAIHIKLCHFANVDIEAELLTDRNDNFLIALYRKTLATKLVTGDKMLLGEAPKFNIKVSTFEQFRNYIGLR